MALASHRRGRPADTLSSELAGGSHGRGRSAEETFGSSDSRSDVAGGSQGRGRGVEETLESSDRSALGPALSESGDAGAVSGGSHGRVRGAEETFVSSDSRSAHRALAGSSDSQSALAGESHSRGVEETFATSDSRRKLAGGSHGRDRGVEETFASSDSRSTLAESGGALPGSGNAEDVNDTSGPSDSLGAVGGVDYSKDSAGNARFGRAFSLSSKAVLGGVDYGLGRDSHEGSDFADASGSDEKGLYKEGLKRDSDDDGLGLRRGKGRQVGKQGGTDVKELGRRGVRGRNKGIDVDKNNTGSNDSEFVRTHRVGTGARRKSDGKASQEDFSDAKKELGEKDRLYDGSFEGKNGKSVVKSGLDDVIDGVDRKKDRESDIEDGRCTENKLDRVSMYNIVGSDSYESLGRKDSDEIKDYSGHSLLMHMYKIDDKDYENCLIGDYRDLKETRKGKRALEQTDDEVKPEGKKHYSLKNFDTIKIKSTDNSDNASNSGKLKSMVKCTLDVKVNDRVLEENKNANLTDSNYKDSYSMSQFKRKIDAKKHYYLKYGKRREYIDVIEEENSRDIYPKRSDKDVDRENNEDWDTVRGQLTYENGDRNNNLLDQGDDENKLRARAHWIARNTQVIDKSEVVERQDARHMDTKTETVSIVGGNASSSGVEGSSERSEGSSDESSTNIPEKIANLGTRVFPTKTKLYEILSKRSGMSDSFSERESEIHAGTDTSEGGRPHARAREKKKVLVKLLPIKQDSNTSDSGSGDEIMPASDLSDRKVRRIKKERRSSDLVEEKMGEFADSSSEGGLTSSDSAKANMSDPEISNRRRKVVTDTTLSDDKILLSKSEDMLNASEVNKKFASLKNVTPLRQPSYKIAVKNGEHSEQFRETYPEAKLTISNAVKVEMKTPKENIESEIEKKQFEPSKKPFLRKVSYEKAVRGGEISITPSPTSKNPFRTNLVTVMTLPHHLRPSYDTNARKTKSMELLDQSNVILEGHKTVSLTEVPRTISADTLEQSKLRLLKSTSELTMIKLNTSEQQHDISDSSNTTSNTFTRSTKTTPIRYSNFEKLLPLGGILSLIKGKPCSGTSESQGSVVSLSSDSKSAPLPSTAQSCDNVSNLSGRSNSSTPVEELIHVIKNDDSALDTIVVYTWNAKCENSDTDSKSESMKCVRQSPVIVEDNEACGSQEDITSKKQHLPSTHMKSEATDTIVATTHPYDNMMKIMLTNEIPDINKIIIRKLKSSHAKASSNSARRFLIDGEVILLEDDLSICKDCNIPPVQILWARQIIARLDDQRVYANIPPYAENLSVIRRILAKTNADSEEELAATGKAFRPNVDVTRGLKIKLIKRKGPRKNVQKFIKGAIEVIPEVSDEEYSADDNMYSQKINATSLRGKGCQRRNLTRKARAYDQRQMKKFKMELHDTSSNEKQNLLSSETFIDPAKSKKLLGYVWNKYKKRPKSGFKSSLKVKQLDERISNAFKTYEEKRPSVLMAPYRLGLQCEAAKMTDSIEDEEDWKAENPLENYSVRFSKKVKVNDDIPRRKKSDLKLWWKMLKSLKKSKNTAKTNKPRTRFPAVPLSMNLIAHEKGRLEIMYGDKDVYPFTVGEYSIEDGRYLTLEEFFLKKYHYYQPPEDYFFNVNGRNTNLTSIQMNRKLNIFRQSGSKIRHFSPIYVFKPTNNPGVCTKKRNSTSKQILRQFFTRGDESSAVDRGYLEKPLPKRRISMPYLPSRRAQKMTVQFSEIPPKVGPKPKKYQTVRTDENDAHIDDTEETRTPELPSNVKHLKPGMYFYPYSDDDSKPKYFLKITISESKPPVVSFHCVEGHPVLEHLIEKRLSLNDGDLEKWDPVIFKINPNEVNVQTYDLRMCPPCLLSEELVNNDDKAISNVNESNAVQETHFSTFEDTSNDSQRRCLHRTDKPITGLYEGKFPLLRDSITHKLVERTQLDRDSDIFGDKTLTLTRIDQLLTEKYQQDIRTPELSSKFRSPIFKETFEEKVMSPKPEDLPRKSAAFETKVQSQKHEYTRSSHIEIPDTIHRVSPQSGAKHVIKPYISAITALEPDHQTRLCQSYPSTNVPSPTQLSNPEADTHSLYEQTSDSMQHTSQDPKPCSCELQNTEQSRILPVAAPRHSLAETLPDWYLPRHPRSNIAQKSLETDARPVYANASVFKGARSLSESQKYPWDSQNQGLTIPCKPTVQRRLSTGETDLPHYENVFFPETCQQNTEDSFVTDIQHRLLHISDIQQRYPVPISPTQERQQQLSPSYYSLSHYPLTDDGYPVCSTLRHVDGSYSEKIIHMPASRHSMSSAARHFVRSQNVPETHSGLYLKHCPWSPMKSQHSEIPERRYSREYVLTDSDFSLGRVSSSSGPSTDPILYPCMARHSIGTVSERVQLHRTQEILRLSSTIRNVGLQGKYRSRSSEFLDEMRDRRLDTGKKIRFRKKSDDAKHVSRSNEDIAERIAHHYLVDNASSAVIPKDQIKRMKKHKDRYLKKHSGRISHSSEDIANRIAYHYVTEFKGEDGSLMSSRTTVSSPFHGRRSPVTSAFPDFPLDTQERPRSTPFSWCYGGILPENVGPVIKDSPIWGKVRKGRTRTV